MRSFLWFYNVIVVWDWILHCCYSDALSLPPAIAQPVVTKVTSSTFGTGSFLLSVASWLDEEGLSWNRVDPTLFPQTNCPVLRVSSSTSPPSSSSSSWSIKQEQQSAERSLWLHLLASPQSAQECVSCNCTREMIMQQQQEQQHRADHQCDLDLIHLHQDVWNNKQFIVKNRLLLRLGKYNHPPNRIYARKTKVRRITAAVALPFLQHNHLWSSVKSKYYYGLYHTTTAENDNNDIETLVAVASFSSRRKIVRGGILHKSHELIRFCTRCDGMVVGGISKLLNAFIKDQQADDIVTVVDRDWGPGNGWHSLGFQTVHIMPPLVMAISKTDGLRRHLVGAGIQPSTLFDNNQQQQPTNTNKDRLGLERHVLEELDKQTSYQDALACLEHHGYYPVYDAGVERLFMIVPNQMQQNFLSPLELWQQSIPTYAATYYSDNAGINALVEHAREKAAMQHDDAVKLSLTPPPPPPLSMMVDDDSTEAQQAIVDWKATGGTAKMAKLLFSAPSSLDPNATVEVRQRPRGGWCTLGIVGGKTKSIYHGIYKINNSNDNILVVDPSVLVSEHLRTMASVALAALVAVEGNNCSSSSSTTTTTTIFDTDDPLSFLYFGYGAGVLSRFMQYTVPNSQHVSIELDGGVVQAAKECQLIVGCGGGSSSLQHHQEVLHLGDALQYQRPNTQEPFDCLFVDVFDEDNLLPCAFYHTSFLCKVKEELLQHKQGIVVHNFHTGNGKLKKQLEDAIQSYRTVFPTVMVMDSMDSRPNAGNTILLASTSSSLLKNEDLLCRAATTARSRWNVPFDLATRATYHCQTR